MFIQTESTPNPETLKFIPGRAVLDGATRDFASAESAAISPLAQALFAVDGVKRVYLADEFLTVTKASEVEWAHLKPALLGAIMEHFVSDRPVLLEETPEETSASVAYEGEAAEIVEQIQELIDTRVRPAVAQDGGDIVFHSWEHETGTVRLLMRGACSGCPSSTMTLKQGIETMLRHYVPEVRTVEQVL